MLVLLDAYPPEPLHVRTSRRVFTIFRVRSITRYRLNVDIGTNFFEEASSGIMKVIVSNCASWQWDSNCEGVPSTLDTAITLDVPDQ